MAESESLWVDCKTCKKKISVSAKACPSCGAPLRKNGSFKWIVVGVAVVAALAAIGKTEKGSDEKVLPPSLSAPAANNGIQSPKFTATAPVKMQVDKVELLERQIRFSKLVADFQSRFQSAQNELQQTLLSDQRNQAIFSELGPSLSVSGWIGTIARLETTSDGKAILSIELSPGVRINTWNNVLSDLIDQTLIDKTSPLYGSLLGMKVGDTVRVGGRFMSDEPGIIKETSLTIRGSMMEPEFLFKFNALSER